MSVRGIFEIWRRRELSLERELGVERQRFANKWLFPWHNITIEGRVVDVEDFRGGNIRVGGIVFQGQIQEIYWQSIRRYLFQKIDETFQAWDVASRSYPEGMRVASLEGVEVLLKGFVAHIVKNATNTDQALRGRGDPKSVDAYNSSGVHSDANAQILRLADAHRLLMDQSRPKPPVVPVLTRLQRLEKAFRENTLVVWVIDLLVTIGRALKIFL